jgi:tetratricopeptide (TPR) repeat protein
VSARRAVARTQDRVGQKFGNREEPRLSLRAGAAAEDGRAGALVARDSSDRAAQRTIALAHEKLSDAEAWAGRLPEGVTHARHALAQWQALADAAPASVSARRAVATSHLKLGDLLGNPYLPSLSDRAGAAAQYARALALLQDVPADSLEDWNTRRLVALLHERVGALHHADKRYADAIAEYRQTLALREALVRERSTSFNAQRDVAVTHQILCEAQLAAGDTRRAAANCRRGVELYESLSAADPRNVQSVHDVASGLLSMQKLVAAQGDPSAALAHLERSMRLLRGILGGTSDNVAAKRDLARGLLYASTLHAALASRGGAAAADRGAHRERATASYAEGARLMAEATGRSAMSPDDSALVARAKTAAGR